MLKSWQACALPLGLELADICDSGMNTAQVGMGDSRQRSLPVQCTTNEGHDA